MNTIKSLIVVSIALLSTGLVYEQIANGYVDADRYDSYNPNLAKQVRILNNLEFIQDYCLEHYSTPFNNPVQDLIDMGQVMQEVKDLGVNDCKVVGSIAHQQDLLTADMMRENFANSGCKDGFDMKC